MKSKSSSWLKLAGNWIRANALNVWLVAVFICGLTAIFMIPPIYGNDEIVHFPRAYQVSRGTFWTQKFSDHDYGGYVPRELKEFNDGFREQVQNNNPDPNRLKELRQQYSKQKLETPDDTRLSFTSAGPYSPWSYFPAAFGMLIARIADLPIIWYVYLSRLSCFIFWLMLTYGVLRILPTGKLFMASLALLPPAYVQASTIGMDGVVNGVSWLIIALTIAVLARTIKFTKGLFGLMVFLAFFLATTKQGYLLIAAFPLIIPASFYPYSGRKALKVRVGFSLALALITMWYISVTGPIASILHFVQRPGLHVDSLDQIAYILTNPFEVLLTILITPLTVAYAGVYAGLVGVLTNKLLYLPIAVIVLLYVALGVALLNFKRSKLLAKEGYRLEWCSAGVLIGTFILSNLALYIAFTKVGNPVIEGFQGRYLLPLAPLLIALRPELPGPAARFIRTYSAGFIAIVMLAGFASTVLALSRL
ncbi:MAG: DUF2142 domain-containing protein [Patescibacteria group bacterium]